MKSKHDSLDPEDWKKIGRKDFQRIERNLRYNDVAAASFFLQQALEKYLKAFLLQHGWKLKKIHTLHSLLKEAVVYKPELESFRQLCQKVSGYYVIDRYPLFTDSGLTLEDIQKDLMEAEKFILALFPEEKLDD